MLLPIQGTEEPLKMEALSHRQQAESYPFINQEDISYAWAHTALALLQLLIIIKMLELQCNLQNIAMMNYFLL